MSSKTDSHREFAGYRLDAGTKVLWRGTEPVALQPKEVEILIVLTEKAGEVITKDELLDRVWAGSIVQETNLARHIYRLRKIFETDGIGDGIIQTVPRRGYRFTADVRTPSIVIERHSVSRTLIEEVSERKSRIGTRQLAVTAVLAIALIAAVAMAVRWAAPQPESKPIRLVAVLPPVPLSGSQQDHAMSLGFADAVITGIGRLSEVKAISTAAVSRFSGDGREPLAIARELGADAVINGTMQRSGDRIRVTMRILRTSDERQIWAGSFDESESNVFRLQDVMAWRAVASLAPGTLGISESKHPTDDIEAYNLYLQGQYLFRRRDTGPAAEFFRRAVTADPKFADAWAGLAAATAMIGDQVTARDAVNKALELNPQLAAAHAVDGFLKMFVDWNWSAARSALQRALEIDPRSVEALHWVGILNTIEGDLQGAKESIGRALELDPSSANLYDDLGHAHYMAKEFGEAERLLLRANEIDERKGHTRLMWIRELQGRDGEVYEYLRQSECLNFEGNKITARCSSNSDFPDDRTRMAALRGRLVEAYIEFAKARKGSVSLNYYAAAAWNVRRGATEEAIDCLTKAFAERLPFETSNFTLPFVAVDPLWDPIRNDPRFKRLTAR